MTIHANVVIVGGGLVGSALACALAEHDDKLSVLVLEASTELKHFDEDSFDPRVVALNVNSINLLKTLGVWECITEARFCDYKRMFVWDGEGNGSIDLNCADVHSDSLGSIVENSTALIALRQKMDSYANVQFFAPAKVESMEIEDNTTALTLNSTLKITGDFVVGADGGHSVLRNLAGMQTREWEYGHSAVVASVRTELSHQNTAWQRFAHSGPLAFLPLRGCSTEEQKNGHYCSIVWSLDKSTSEHVMSLNDKQFCQLLSKHFEYKLGRIVWSDTRHCIPLKQRHALHYGVPGFALIGDAAHTIHPLAGQGVNLGLADVSCLSAEIIRSRIRSIPLRHPSIVKRYQRARKPHNLSVMVAMEGFKHLFGSRDLWSQSIRNRGMDWVDGKSWLKRMIIKMAEGSN